MTTIEYTNNQNAYISSIHEYQYIFELVKCCGYKEWITIYKRKTLKDLYDNLYSQLKLTEFSKPVHLYIIKNGGEIKLVDNDETLLSDYIYANREYFKPVYTLPCKVIYSLYIDDGCCHKDHSSNEILCNIHNEDIELK